MPSKQIATKGNLNEAWWRSLRLLLEQGKPIPEQTILTLGPMEEGPRPFGVLSKMTKKKDQPRLIYWLPSVKNVAEPLPGEFSLPDHLTLDLWNGKGHPTWFNEQGKRVHLERSRGWRLHRFGEHGLALWFTLLIRFSVLLEQDLVVEAMIGTPVSDKERRQEVLRSHLANLKTGEIVIPPDHLGNYAVCSFYVVEDKARLTPNALGTCFPGTPLDPYVDNLDETLCHIAATSVFVQGTEVMIATACPPGELKASLGFGIPRVAD